MMPCSLVMAPLATVAGEGTGTWGGALTFRARSLALLPLPPAYPLHQPNNLYTTNLYPLFLNRCKRKLRCLVRSFFLLEIALAPPTASLSYAATSLAATTASHSRSSIIPAPACTVRRGPPRAAPRATATATATTPATQPRQGPRRVITPLTSRIETWERQQSLLRSKSECPGRVCIGSIFRATQHIGADNNNTWLKHSQCDFRLSTVRWILKKARAWVGPCWRWVGLRACKQHLARSPLRSLETIISTNSFRGSSALWA
ncbi:hypothetical protein P171DRAFT_263060 [Karstenula rhodostoma CBS 690.94]|uniref:Uncharacterized protein n=1 Tax=Karstenula rhodostoma CBS 690.94 TaxID=1392251 RepID=A0A9P4UEW1_9PLEO|nr:hypothetical protein P171DRAFT_263060 [Karstenula rhodostoma CBS 690.94]